MFWTTDATELKRVCEALKDILSQVWFRFEPTGVRLCNVDPEKIVSVDLEFWPGAEQYSCEDVGLTFSCYIQTLYKLIRNTKTGDVARVSDTNMTGDLKIVVTDADGKTKQRILLSSLHDVMPEFYVPVHPYALQFMLPTQKLYQMVHALAGVSRKLGVHVVNDTMTLEAKEETGIQTSMSVVVANLKANKEVNCFIITKYMEKFLKPAPAPQVTVSLDPALPVKLIYTLPTGYLSLSMAVLA